MTTIGGWEFYYWQLWHAERGQLYAHRHSFTTAQEARRAHELAADFHWLPPGARSGATTDLYARASGREQAIAVGARQDRPRRSGPEGRP